MTAFGIQPGDVYCPSSPPHDCQIETELTHGTKTIWRCDRHGAWSHPFEVTPDGRFNWLWSDENPPIMPGCPWCDSRNYLMEDSIYDDRFWFRCQRQSCGRNWVGNWTRRNDDWKTDKWLIRMSVDRVTWASGTIADLECYRRIGVTESDASGTLVNCCRWPKTCSAYDPGFTTGNGPTTLPVVWNDGFGWRSGPPDVTAIPPHLVEQTLKRWIAADLDRRGVE